MTGSMHTIFDTAGTQYAVARRHLDDRLAVYAVHAGPTNSKAKGRAT
jgi:hypothetical protein